MSENAVPEGQAGSGSPMSEAKPEQKAGTLDIKIKDQQENETFFKIKNHTKFGKVFDAYCDRQSLARNTVRFLFEGTRVQDTDTPESLDLEDGDMIQAMLEQVGGDGSDAGAPAAEDEKPEKAGVINIKVKDQNEGEAFFKIKGHTKLGKVFDVYCDRQSLARNAVRFLFEGARIQDTDTPDSLEMQDGDMVQAMLEQVGGADEAGSADAKPEQKPEGGEHINIKVKDQNHQEIFFKIKPTTQILKVKKAYCDRQGLDILAVRFLFDGDRLQDDDTPASREMEDGDCIDVFLQQIGGTVDEAMSNGDAKPEPQRMSIKVKDANGYEVEFKCKSTTVLKKLMDAFCHERGRKPDSVRFFTPDGKRVTSTDTPQSLALEDGDLIEVHEEQQGGGL